METSEWNQRNGKPVDGVRLRIGARFVVTVGSTVAGTVDGATGTGCGALSCFSTSANSIQKSISRLVDKPFHKL